MSEETEKNTETKVYVLKPEEVTELGRMFDLYKIHHFGVTNKGKVIVEYEDDFFCLITKCINP